MENYSFVKWRHYAFLTIVVIFLKGCTLAAPAPGTIISKSNVHKLSKDGITVSVYGYVKQGQNESFPEQYAACRLEQADFTTADTVKVEIGAYPHVWFSHDFRREDLNRWTQCYAKPVGWGNRRTPFSFERIGVIEWKGCAKHQQFKTVSDGSRVLGTVCKGQLNEGAKVSASGKLSLCRVVKDTENYDGWAGRKKTRCLETDVEGRLQEIRQYYVGDLNLTSKEPELDGTQITYTKNGDVSLQYYDEGKSIALKRQISNERQLSLREQRKKYKSLEESFNKQINSTENKLNKIRSAQSELSQVKRMFRNAEPVDYCGCVWKSCLLLETREQRNRSAAEKAAAKRLLEARETMCRVLRQAGIIEVDSWGSVTVANGESSIGIDAALSSGDFSNVRLKGDGGALLRKAQQQFHEANILAQKAKEQRSAKARALAELIEKQARERNQEIEDALQAEKERVEKMAKIEKVKFENFKACTARYGLDWSQREQWSVIPDECI